MEEEYSNFNAQENWCLRRYKDSEIRVYAGSDYVNMIF